MTIVVRCANPDCNSSYTVAESFLNREVVCKRCGTRFVARATLDGPASDTIPNSAPGAEPFTALPAEFGRYRVLRLIGRGGMGSVYLAADSHLDRRVALKFPAFTASESSQRAARFVREARSAARLQHPNICTIYDSGEIGGRPFISMAFVEGKPLDELLDAGRIPERQAAELTRKIAEALAHAHSMGVVHRDMKPANVMITAKDEPVVMDFGLAKRMAEAEPSEGKLTKDGSLLGTPRYMAPEQVRGEVDRIGPTTDVYALGVMLFEMLAGQAPYTGPVGVVMGQILAAPVPQVSEFRPDVDPRLANICLRAMAKDPAHRLPSMEVFAQELDQSLRDQSLDPKSAHELRALAPELNLMADDLADFSSVAARPSRATRQKWYERVLLSWRDPKALTFFGVGAAVLALLVTLIIMVTRPPNQAPSDAKPQDVRVASQTRQKSNPASATDLIEQTSPAEKTDASATMLSSAPNSMSQSDAVKPDRIDPLFNGTDLTGWIGMPDAWRVEGNAIKGKLPAGRTKHTFLCTQQEYTDFELKLKIRLRNGVGNSGVQVRSQLLDRANYVVAGPQVEVDAFKFGGVYGERTGGWMKQISEDRVRRVFKADAFNDYSIRAVGKRLTVAVNGETIVDEEFPAMSERGIIALQLHGGMKSEEVIFSDIELHDLSTAPVTATQPDDLQRIQGRWYSVAEEFNGVATSADDIRRQLKTVVVSNDEFIIQRYGDNGRKVTFTGKVRLDSSKNPKWFDWTGSSPGGRPAEMLGLYELSNDTFRVVYSIGERGNSIVRPTRFNTVQPGGGTVVMVLKRQALD